MEGFMAETPGAKATVVFQDIEVTASKKRILHIEAAGRSASAAFLDQAIELVLPRLTYEERTASRSSCCRQRTPGRSP
jgi:hypothetical protein